MVPTHVEIDGQIYGTQPSELGPIGGGDGDSRIITEGDYSCTALVFAQEFVIEIPEGVSLASNRGHNGSRGAVIFSNAHATDPMIRLVGPPHAHHGHMAGRPEASMAHRTSPPLISPGMRTETTCTTIEEGPGGSHAYYYRFPTSGGICLEYEDIEIDNCKIPGWTRGVRVGEVENAHIHHNYIHHPQYYGLGYGVSHSDGHSLTEHNLFERQPPSRRRHRYRQRLGPNPQ